MPEAMPRERHDRLRSLFEMGGEPWALEALAGMLTQPVEPRSTPVGPPEPPRTGPPVFYAPETSLRAPHDEELAAWYGGELAPPDIDVADLIEWLSPLGALGLATKKVAGGVAKKGLAKAQRPLIDALEAFGVRIAKRPHFNIGDSVKLKGAKRPGAIVGYDRDEAKYWVEFPDSPDPRLVDPIELKFVGAKDVKRRK